jgi:hypothetical protein
MVQGSADDALHRQEHWWPRWQLQQVLSGVAWGQVALGVCFALNSGMLKIEDCVKLLLL